jgi:hypothetical protein
MPKTFSRGRIVFGLCRFGLLFFALIFGSFGILAAEVIVNGGFESGFNGWGQGGPRELVSRPVATGSKAARVYGDACWAGTISKVDGIIRGNRNYEISFQLRAEDNNAGVIIYLIAENPSSPADSKNLIHWKTPIITGSQIYCGTELGTLNAFVKKTFILTNKMISDNNLIGKRFNLAIYNWVRNGATGKSGWVDDYSIKIGDASVRDYAVNTISDLKALAGIANGKTAWLEGYRNHDDGGEGFYRFDSTITTSVDDVAVVLSTGSTGSWIRQPMDASYPVSAIPADPVYFSWLDPDPTAQEDCRNKMQLALNAAGKRAGSGAIGKLFITPGDFKLVSTMGLSVGNVSMEGLSGHKLWNSLPSGYGWSATHYDGTGDHRYTATKVINNAGNAVTWTSWAGIGKPWNGKTEFFTFANGLNSFQRCEIKNLVFDGGWGTQNPPGTVDIITGISTILEEFTCYQMFGNCSHVDFNGCNFSNSPGCVIEVGSDNRTMNCTFTEYGDHVYYFGGTNDFLFENNRIIGTRSSSGGIDPTTGVPSADYVGLSDREALKFRGCRGIIIQDNSVSIPKGKFVTFQTSGQTSGQSFDCGGYDASNRAVVSGNAVDCWTFATFYGQRRSLGSTFYTDEPYYVQHIDFFDNTIKVGPYLFYSGAWGGTAGAFRDVRFLRNGIETTYDGYGNRYMASAMLQGSPDFDFHSSGGDYPIKDFYFCDNNVLGGIQFQLHGAVGRFYVAYNTIDASACAGGSAIALFTKMFAGSRLDTTGEVCYLPLYCEGIACNNNVLKNYYSIFRLAGVACTQDWSAAAKVFGYDATILEPDTTPRCLKSLVYYAGGSGNKMYVNNQDCSTQLPTDSLYWEPWIPPVCLAYYKNNVTYNNWSNGGKDFHLQDPKPVDFRYEESGNVIRVLNTGLVNAQATRGKDGATSIPLDDALYEVDSFGPAALRPDQDPDFPR